MLAKNHLPKILVRREEQRRFSVGHVEYRIIRYGRGRLSHLPYLVAILTEAFDDATVNTFISYEVHVVVVSAIG
jgi:hypothetical protein